MLLQLNPFWNCSSDRPHLGEQSSTVRPLARLWDGVVHDVIGVIWQYSLYLQTYTKKRFSRCEIPFQCAWNFGVVVRLRHRPLCKHSFTKVRAPVTRRNYTQDKYKHVQNALTAVLEFWASRAHVRFANHYTIGLRLIRRHETRLKMTCVQASAFSKMLMALPSFSFEQARWFKCDTLRFVVFPGNVCFASVTFGIVHCADVKLEVYIWCWKLEFSCNFRVHRYSSS